MISYSGRKPRSDPLCLAFLHPPFAPPPGSGSTFKIRFEFNHSSPSSLLQPWSTAPPVHSYTSNWPSCFLSYSLSRFHSLKMGLRELLKTQTTPKFPLIGIEPKAFTMANAALPTSLASCPVSLHHPLATFNTPRTFSS